MLRLLYLYFFFFQAEDGIRDHCVTGVQTCALPIFPRGEAHLRRARPQRARGPGRVRYGARLSETTARGDAALHAPLAARQGRCARSEERRVGKEGRSRWAPYH